MSRIFLLKSILVVLFVSVYLTNVNSSCQLRCVDVLRKG